MQLEIISTGDEVITGFITDTNVTFLSQELLALGVQPYRRHTVGDKLADIAALISERAEKRLPARLSAAGRHALLHAGDYFLPESGGG